MDRWAWLRENVEKGQLRLDPKVIRRMEDEKRIASVVAQVRSLRKAQKMSQRQLALKVGSTQAAVSRFESGKKPDVGYLYVRRILDVLGVS